MKVNFTQTEKQNLVALIHESKALSLPENEINFGNPSVLEDNSPFDRNNPNKRNIVPNTSIVVNAESNSQQYIGSYTLRYRRIDLARQWLVLYGGNTVRYTQDTLDEVTDPKVKKFITDRVKYLTGSVNISANLQGNRATVTLSAKPNSLVYVGSVAITIEQADVRIPLESLFTSPDLNGFDYETEILIPEPIIRGFTYNGPVGG